MQSTVSKTHSSHWRGISYRNQHVECLHNALSLEIWYNSENKRFQWQSTILQVWPARSHESPQKAKTEQGLTVTVVSLQINNHTSCLHMQKHRSNLQPSHKDGAAATPLTAQPHCPQSPFLSIFLHKFCQTRRIIVSCSQPLAHISVNVTQIDNLYIWNDYIFNLNANMRKHNLNETGTSDKYRFSQHRDYRTHSRLILVLQLLSTLSQISVTYISS